MTDLKSKKAIWAKGIMFLIIGIMATALIVPTLPDVSTIFLYFVAVWAFCRAYYFAFYVIEHYVDSEFKYAGLIDFARYLIGSGKQR